MRGHSLGHRVINALLASFLCLAAGHASAESLESNATSVSLSALPAELQADENKLPDARRLLTYPGIYLPEEMLIPAVDPLLEEEEIVAADPADNDLWQRIRAGFQLEPDDRRAVQQQLDWYVRHPAYITRVFTRAKRFLPYIVAEAESRGMPLEVALLPVVESAFDPFAYSHGRAAGLWQIIPGTGKRFGLKQNWWYDGRRDPVAATHAALDYLEYLHKLLDNDWLLAVAAYNSGEGNVKRAQRKNLNRSRDTDFWSLSLPKETEAYVPKLLAIRAVVADPESLGLTLPAIEDTPYFEEVLTDSQIDLALAADLAGLDIDELYALNAGFNRWATDPDGPHRLMVPVDAAPVLTQALADLMTMRESSQKNLSEIAVCFMGDVGNNTATSLMVGAALMGMDIRLCGPHQCWPDEATVNMQPEVGKGVVL